MITAKGVVRENRRRNRGWRGTLPSRRREARPRHPPMSPYAGSAVLRGLAVGESSNGPAVLFKVDEGEMSQERADPVLESHREFAKQANGRVWQLLGMADRAPSDDDEMVEAAYASLYHWRMLGKEVNRQRGEWLIAHMHTVLGEPGPALKHADACLTLASRFREAMQDFDIAYAYEGIARALALNRQVGQAKKYLGLAEDSGGKISDPEDKQIFVGDLESGDWYGLKVPGPLSGLHR